MYVQLQMNLCCLSANQCKSSWCKHLYCVLFKDFWWWNSKWVCGLLSKPS